MPLSFLNLFLETDNSKDHIRDMSINTITAPQLKLLKIIDQWAGDLPPDAEEQLGCQGEAFWNVLGALRRRGLITDGAWGTYNLSPEAQQIVNNG